MIKFEEIRIKLHIYNYIHVYIYLYILFYETFFYRVSVLISMCCTSAVDMDGIGTNSELPSTLFEVCNAVIVPLSKGLVLALSVTIFAFDKYDIGIESSLRRCFCP